MPVTKPSVRAVTACSTAAAGRWAAGLATKLTPREREVLTLIAAGATNREIGTRLFLSPHTVRDHVKAVFAKVGVSSRGELVAKLFAEHYAPGHFRDVVHLDA